MTIMSFLPLHHNQTNPTSIKFQLNLLLYILSEMKILDQLTLSQPV